MPADTINKANAMNAADAISSTNAADKTDAMNNSDARNSMNNSDAKDSMNTANAANPPVKILVSQCLYGGPPVRYDGKTKAEADPRFLKWKRDGILVPVCPEVFGGLPVPRPDAQLRGEKVITRTGRDVTANYLSGAEEAVRLAGRHSVICCLLKEKSPSCGSHFIYDGSFSGKLIPGRGLAVSLLEEAGFKVFSEEQLDDVEKLIEKALL